MIADISSVTTVRQLKRALVERKAFPGLGAEPQLFYSPVFAPMPVFGNPMEDDRTLGSYGVLQDDVIFAKVDRPAEEAGSKPAKAPAKKKKK